MANPEQIREDEEPIGSHVLKNPDDEYEVLELLPKEVRDAITNAPVKLRAHWALLNVPKAQALRAIQIAINDAMKERPAFRSLTARQET